MPEAPWFHRPLPPGVREGAMSTVMPSTYYISLTLPYVHSLTLGFGCLFVCRANPLGPPRVALHVGHCATPPPPPQKAMHGFSSDGHRPIPPDGHGARQSGGCPDRLRTASLPGAAPQNGNRDTGSAAALAHFGASGAEVRRPLPLAPLEVGSDGPDRDVLLGPFGRRTGPVAAAAARLPHVRHADEERVLRRRGAWRTAQPPSLTEVMILPPRARPGIAADMPPPVACDRRRQSAPLQ